MYIVIKNGVEGQSYPTIEQAAQAIADAKQQGDTSEFAIQVTE